MMGVQRGACCALWEGPVGAADVREGRRGEGGGNRPHSAQHERSAAKRMCEQAARYCRDGVQKLLQKDQAKLRAQDTGEHTKPTTINSETATAAQPGNGSSQPGAIDGLVRWIVTKMSDNKSISTREYCKEEAAVAQEQFFAPEPRKGISVILDVSTKFSFIPNSIHINLLHLQAIIQLLYSIFQTID